MQWLTDAEVPVGAGRFQLAVGLHPAFLSNGWPTVVPGPLPTLCSGLRGAVAAQKHTSRRASFEVLSSPISVVGCAWLFRLPGWSHSLWSSNFLDLLSFLSLLCPAFPLILWDLTPIINLLAWNSWCFCFLVEPWLIQFFVLKLKTCFDTFFFAVCICHELLFFLQA